MNWTFCEYIVYLIYCLSSNHLNHSSCLSLFLTHDNPKTWFISTETSLICQPFLHPGLSTKQKWQLEEFSFSYAAKLDLIFSNCLVFVTWLIKQLSQTAILPIDKKDTSFIPTGGLYFQSLILINQYIIAVPKVFVKIVRLGKKLLIKQIFL